MVHKVGSDGTATEESDDITFSKVAGFYSEMFNELKPKGKPQESQSQGEERSFDGSHMD